MAQSPFTVSLLTMTVQAAQIRVIRILVSARVNTFVVGVHSATGAYMFMILVQCMWLFLQLLAINVDSSTSGY